MSRRVLASMFALVVVATHGGTATAQPTATGPHAARPTKLVIAPRPSPRPRPKTAPPPAPASQASVADRLIEREDEVSDIRQQQLDLLVKLIAATPDSDATEKAALYLRLAEGYAQRDRFHRFAARKAEIAADAAASPKDRTRLAREAADHDRQARRALDQAIAAYQALVDNPLLASAPKLDEALFYLGYSLQRATRAEDARGAFHRLLTEHPQSRFVPEAYLAFADAYFAANQLANAQAFYQKVQQFPASKVYAYAGYMLGWVHLNRGEHVEAGRQFLQVIRDTDGKPTAETLHRAAQQDFVRAFAEFGQVDKAWAAFQKIAGDGPGAARMYERLADLYVEQGKPDRAVYAYRRLIVESPAAPHVCLWQYGVAQAMLSTVGATHASKAEEIVRLTQLWSALDRQRTLPPADASECHDNARAMVGDLARTYHSEGMRSHDPDFLVHAERLYDLYLASFPDADDLGETQYYRADLAWTRAEREANARRQPDLWRRAAVAFTAVLDAGKVDASLKKEAAYALVLSRTNLVAARPPVASPPVSLDPDDQAIPAPLPIPDDEQGVLDAVSRYRDTITDPADRERVGLTVLAASTYRRYHRFDQAIPLLDEVVDRHSEHETALDAANLLLDIHVVTHAHDRLQARATWIAQHPEFLTAREGQDRSALTARVRDIHVISRRLRAQALEAEAARTGDLRTYVACGNTYLDLFNDTVSASPGAGIADKVDEVLYDAGVCYELGRSLSAAISAFQEVRERFPDSPAAARALARLGAVYARVAYYQDASKMFEEYARKYAGQADADRALNDAVFYRKGIGDDDQAIANTRYFVSKFGGKQPAAAASAFFSLASIYEKQGDPDQLLKHYRAYLKSYDRKGRADHRVAAYARLGELLWDQSCPVATVDGSCVTATRERAVGTRATTARRRRDPGLTQCGPRTKLAVREVARDPAKVRAALAAFAAATEAFERAGGKFPDGDEPAARRWYASARFHQTEVDYEAFLGIEFPDHLDFDPARPAAKKRSDARLAAWIAAKQRLGAKAMTAYRALIFEVKDPANAIAAAARIGQLAQQFADALYTAEVPAFLRSYDDAVEVYCDSLTRAAEPYEAAAIEGFGACLDASSQFGWFSRWSQLCERELGQIRPEQYPTASERRAAFDPTSRLSDVEPPIARLD